MEEKYTFIKERVLHFAKNQGITIESFLDSIGMTYGSFKGKAKKGTLNSSAIEEIYTKYPDISLEWLITGNGEMLKTGDESSGFVTEDVVRQSPTAYENEVRWKDLYIEVHRKYSNLQEEHILLLKNKLKEYVEND